MKKVVTFALTAAATASLLLGAFASPVGAEEYIRLIPDRPPTLLAKEMPSLPISDGVVLALCRFVWNAPASFR